MAINVDQNGKRCIFSETLLVFLVCILLCLIFTGVLFHLYVQFLPLAYRVCRIEETMNKYF